MAKILPFIIIAISFFVGGYLLYRELSIRTEPTPEISQVTSSPSPVIQDLKEFTSMSLLFSVNIPLRFQVEEKAVRVTFSGPEGKIYIDRNSTDYDNIEDYLKDLHRKNQVILDQEKRLSINNQETISGFINNDKNYYIYADNWVYLISTSSESLYSDLDQIAQSFRYTP